MLSASFPNEQAISRLVGTILREQNDDEWAAGRVTLETIATLGDNRTNRPACRGSPITPANSAGERDILHHDWGTIR